MNPLAIVQLASSAAKIVKYVVEDNATDKDVKQLKLTIKELKKEINKLSNAIEDIKKGAK